MDDVRKMKFIKQYEKRLNDLKKNEKNEKIQKEIESLFYDKALSELTKTKVRPRFENYPQKKRILLNIIYSENKKEHKPIETALFLSLFSKSESLRYLIHEWDESREVFNYQDFIGEVLDEFLEKGHQLKNIPKSLLVKIFTFLFEENIKNGWGFQQIRFGWSSKFLSNWCIENTGVYPKEMKVPDESRKYSIRNKEVIYPYFQDMIQKFKSEIRFTNAGNQFEKFLRRKCREFQLNELNFQFDRSLRGVDFFTDVDKLSSGLKKVLSGMNQRRQYPKVEFSVSGKGNSIEFKIMQYDSKVTREDPNEMKIENIGFGGDFASAYNNFSGICDWSFEGPFGDGKSYRVNYLRPLEKAVIEASSITEGVQHTLTFYRPNS